MPLRKLFVLAVLLLAFLVLWQTEWGRSFLLHTFTTDIQALSAYLQSLGWKAWAIALFLATVQNFISVVPSLFLIGAFVHVFGWTTGLLLAWIGELVGAALAFSFFRYYGRSFVVLWLSKHKQLNRFDQWISKNAFMSILLLRLAPFVPSGVINMAAAFSGASFWAFMAATALGKIPMVLFDGLMGHDIYSITENGARLIVVTLAMILFAFLVHHYRKKMHRSSATSGP
ncbi:TVP38/TMEM64 family protein [Heliorestis convoluta]|uniref:TVP38/TMEM64 family membrane protein n=1 Tax=Heliorestis convoluta TaxID=356322 RepID=A0A5Q2MXQ1_9FIRM|nr:TVP38/TMEM64 family protein [Heliorestis convoluta]QGG46621.1 hypothetical protein FTV88_0442 [Heliorestis convoluta]